MTKNRVAAMAASVFLFLVCVLPANAAVLFSLTGTVGDSNWFVADPQLNQPTGSVEMLLDIPSVFQVNGGPGGPITVNFSGAPILISRDTIAWEEYDDTVSCLSPSGCYACTDPDAGCTMPGFTENRFQIGGDDECCMIDPIDSNFYVQEQDTPPFAPYGATFESYQKGNIDYTFDAIVGPDAIGQPFSLTVDTVPEPATWAMLLAGFSAIGFMLRRSRRKLFTATENRLGEVA